MGLLRNYVIYCTEVGKYMHRHVVLLWEDIHFDIRNIKLVREFLGYWHYYYY